MEISELMAWIIALIFGSAFVLFGIWLVKILLQAIF